MLSRCRILDGSEMPKFVKPCMVSGWDFSRKPYVTDASRDRAAYMEKLADDVEANKPNAQAAVQSILARKRRKPFAPEVLPAIKDADGCLCENPEDAVTRWREHFSALEDGHAMGPGHLLQHVISASEPLWPAPEELGFLPSPMDVRNALLLAKRGKACGPDAIPGELGLANADATQAILFPLALKLGLLGEESMGYKSGTLTWLWKGKGPQSECSSYRGILLLSNMGKALHRAYRPQIQRHFEQHAAPMQLGGRRASSVVFGSHAMRTFMRWKASVGRPSAVLFADVSSAYYSTLRALASRFPSAESAVCAGSSLGALAEDIELSIEEQLRKPSALKSTGASQWLQAITTTLNSGTWMCLRGDATPVATMRGTRPGSAWADLTFGFVIRRILALRDDYRRALRGVCKPVQVPWDQHRDWRPIEETVVELAITDLVWADDVASCFDVDNASEASRGIGQEAGVLADSFASHALELAFGPLQNSCHY